MLKLSVVVGARPQFVKAAALHHAWKADFQEDIQWELIHTGQHYDQAMSGIFFEELGLSPPNHGLHIHGAGPVDTVADMSKALSTYYGQQRPDVVLVFGDTHSTLSAALTAAGLSIPLAHVEAGLRSFRRDMPEEQARVVTDHLSHWLFAPSAQAMDQLRREGLTEKPDTFCREVGDIMLDAARIFSDAASTKESNGPILATLHRNFNTDQPERLAAALARMQDTAAWTRRKIHFIVHPRTQKAMDFFGLQPGKDLVLVAPMGYRETLTALHQAPFVLTDSGGLQKEAFFLGKRSICFRPESEWRELVSSGWVLCPDLDATAWRQAVQTIQNTPNPVQGHWYGNGEAGKQILTSLFSSP